MTCDPYPIDPSLWALLQDRFEREDDAAIRDVLDGKEYRVHHDFLCDRKPGNVSFLCNTDGMQVFRSSSYTIWPIWLVINELPAHVRYAMVQAIVHKIFKSYLLLCRFTKRNMLLAGLWFSKTKPTVTTFLRPLMSTMNELYQNGES